MKKFLSLTMTVLIMVSIMVIDVSAATPLGNFSDYLNASEKSTGTETSYQWIESSKNGDIYQSVTVVKFPVGTYITLNDIYTYYLEINGQEASLQPGDTMKWIPMTNEFTIPDDHIVYAIRVWNHKTGAVKLVFVQGTPGTKASDHSGSLQEGTAERPRIFSDVPNDAWYQGAVVYCYQANIMSGVTKTEFAPDRELTRAMVWVMFARIDGVQNVGGSTWYEGAQKWAKKVGLSDGTAPNASVTRQQFAAMAHRYWKYKNLPESYANAAANKYGLEGRTLEFNEYQDTNDISAYALESMKWAVHSGLIEQDTNCMLNPAKVLNRAQVSYFMASFYETWAPWLQK